MLIMQILLSVPFCVRAYVRCKCVNANEVLLVLQYVVD